MTRTLSYTAFFILLALLINSCNKDDGIGLNLEEQNLINALNESIDSDIGSRPLQWSDAELDFLDPIAENEIIGLGESTHGTAEFFQAKHRILQYLVENHGFKTFAIEADFGESVIINEAVQKGSVEEIEELMTTYMHFWTWKTKDVLEMIRWMAEYNQGKPESERIRYVGVDCQANTYNPQLLDDYLNSSMPEQFEFASAFLEQITEASNTNYQNLELSDFERMITNVGQIREAMETNREGLEAAAGFEDYQFNMQLLDIIEQALLIYNERKDPSLSTSSRDRYMAKNTVWAQEFYGDKTVLWAHNLHVGKDFDLYNGSGSQGHHIKLLNPKYTAVGFSFGMGSFNAFRFHLQTYSLFEFTITDPPQRNTLNFLFHSTGEDAFYLNFDALMTENEDWGYELSRKIEHLEIGAVFNGNPEDYLWEILDTNYDHIIYFENTTASEQLE